MINTLSKAGQKITLENKKASQNGMDHMSHSKKLGLCVLSVLVNVGGRIDDKFKKRC